MSLPIRVESHSKGWLLALSANIRQQYNWMTVTNTPAYCNTRLITVVKKRVGDKDSSLLPQRSWLTVTNAPAYYLTGVITAVKKFYSAVPWSIWLRPQHILLTLARSKKLLQVQSLSNCGSDELIIRLNGGSSQTLGSNHERDWHSRAKEQDGTGP